MRTFPSDIPDSRFVHDFVNLGRGIVDRGSWIVDRGSSIVDQDEVSTCETAYSSNRGKKIWQCGTDRKLDRKI